MNSRRVLVAAAVLTGGVAVALAVLPTSMLGSLLDVDGPAATAFLVRRYAVSATAALCVAIIGIARRSSPERAALLAVATWFAVQGIVALLGLATGDVGGLAWVAVVADPLLAAGFLLASRGAGSRSSRALPA
ncbi:hypothetical protein [Nonomuraea turcica]|uniref:hypothetical protein n=1 Tax=Nonomuraea sp. G32 TaxID=3067274 RepID=UPI00273C95BE|nr:hypothetical protein [Nonomuraea sp. G32]MDP4510542.1 hypothetical protein [Nonomuraea sp. G32]